MNKIAHNKNIQIPPVQIPKKRLFVAVSLSDTVKKTLAGLPNIFAKNNFAFKDNNNVLRWTKPENLHLTLRFIGETPLGDIDVIKNTLTNVTATNFKLQLKGLGLFKNGNILWAGVTQQEELTELKRQIDTLLSLIPGYAIKPVRFLPHITLARLKCPIDEAFKQFVEAKRDMDLGEMQVLQFALFQSMLDPSGAVHTVEQIYTLDSKTSTQVICPHS